MDNIDIQSSGNNLIRNIRLFFFVVYISMLLLSTFDFELNIRTISYGFIIVGIGIIIMSMLWIFFDYAGYDIYKYNYPGKTPLFGIIILTSIVILSLIFYWEYYYIYGNITRKIHDNIIEGNRYPLIVYEYGRDSQEIAGRLELNNDTLTHNNQLQSLQKVWEYLMYDKSQNKIRTIITKILGTELNDTIDVHYDLFWYLSISNNPLHNRLSNKEIKYIVSLSCEKLRDLLGPSYNGPIDRASMLFTCLSGRTVPMYRNNIRYDQIKQYSPDIIYNLAFIHNKMIDSEKGAYSVHGPYTYLSMQPVSDIENIMISVNQDNYTEFITQLGIGPMHGITTVSEKISYLIGEISLYHGVFNRPEGLNAPPDLQDKNKDEIINILSQYTNLELINTYEPRTLWTSRSDLINIITDDILGPPKWSIISTNYCNNDDTINIITGENHSDTNKSDIDDPTLSYGSQKNYRCYQLSELEASFRDYDGIFMFRVPDWTNTSSFAKEFPLKSIKQLKSLLESVSTSYNVTSLINKISQGLNILKSASNHIKHLKSQLVNFNSDDLHIIKLYLAWMFNYSMWMRFWPGPGHPWPLQKVNVNNRSARNLQHRTSPLERDEYIFIQNSIRTNIIELYEKNSELKEWIESLPVIYYDFETKESSVATHKIKDIIDQIVIGDYCMGFGSDTILKTAYYYIVHLLDYSEGTPLDEFLNTMMPLLIDIEYNTINNELPLIHRETFRRQLLQNRLQQLNNPLPRQPSFNSTYYQNNIHVQ